MLTQLPFWVWVITPAIILAAVTYWFTRKWVTALLVVIVGSVVAWGAAILHWWEGYLHNHFIGTYDQHGIPYRLSQPGWEFLKEAWPLWTIPTVVMAILALIGAWYLHRYLSQRTTGIQPVIGHTDTEVALQLEIDKLKQSVEQYESLFDKSQVDQEAMHELQLENQTLKQEIEDLLDELTRTRTVIDTMMEDKEE